MRFRSASGRDALHTYFHHLLHRNGSRFNSIWPAERRSTFRKISTMRASRLDSELISSAIWLPLFLRQA